MAVLPQDIMLRIYQHLPGKNIVRGRCVNKYFDSMLCSLVIRLDITKSVTQESLEAMAASYSNLTYLDISLEYEDETSALN